MATSQEKFVKAVFIGLPELGPEDSSLLEQFESLCKEQFDLGWSLVDTRRWLRTFEEFNPEMEEDHALRIRVSLEKKYRKD